MIQVYCINTATTKEFVEGTTLLEVLDEFDFDRPYPIVSAKVNNASQGLRFRLYNSRDVEFLDVRSLSAMHVYIRSLCFLLYKASVDLFSLTKAFRFLTGTDTPSMPLSASSAESLPSPIASSSDLHADGRLSCRLRHFRDGMEAMCRFTACLALN